MTSIIRPDPRTGRLVRSVVVTPGKVQPKKASEPAAEPRVFDSTVQEIAATHSLPPQLLHSVIKAESNYNPFAVSPKGALGMMQLIPATARRFGVSDVFDIQQNIEGGAKYLRHLLDLFKGDYRLALAAYNAGEGAVAKYGGIPPYAETQNYVAQVGKHLEAQLAASSAPVEVKSVEAPAGPPRIQEIVEADGTVRYVSR